MPKPELLRVRVTLDGVDGDYNVWRQESKGGDRDYGLLIMPKETLDQLNHEGWPVRPGDVGENITSEGIPYEALRPPCRLRVGSVLVEISKACDPCNNLTLLPYVGTLRAPEFLKVMMGRRGWYARVVAAGEIRQGDPIRLER